MSAEEIKEIVITFTDDFSITYKFQDQLTLEFLLRYLIFFLGIFILYNSELMNKWKSFKRKDLQ